MINFIRGGQRFTPTDLWQVVKQVHHLSQHRITCPLPPANCHPATPRRTNPIPSSPRHCDASPDRTSLCSSPGFCSDVQFSETIYISRYLFDSGGLCSFVVSSVYFCTLCHEDQRRNSVSALISLTKILGTLLQAVFWPTEGFHLVRNNWLLGGFLQTVLLCEMSRFLLSLHRHPMSPWVPPAVLLLGGWLWSCLNSFGLKVSLGLSMSLPFSHIHSNKQGMIRCFLGSRPVLQKAGRPKSSSQIWLLQHEWFSPKQSGSQTYWRIFRGIQAKLAFSSLTLLLQNNPLCGTPFEGKNSDSD